MKKPTNNQLPIPKSRQQQRGDPDSMFPRLPLRLKGLQDQLMELIKLEEDWDGNGAPKISPTSIGRAYKWIYGLFYTPEELPLPQVVPTINGGVQWEWDKDSIALEIEFNPDSTITAFYRDDSEEWDKDVSTDLQTIRSCLKKIADVS